MAPAPLSPELEALAEYFQKCGLAPTASVETVRGKAKGAAQALFTANKLEDKQLNNKQGLFALQVAKDGSKLTEESRNYAVEAIVDGRLKSPDQVTGESYCRTPFVYVLGSRTYATAAIKYLAANPAPLDAAAFDKACGVGASFSCLVSEL